MPAPRPQRKHRTRRLHSSRLRSLVESAQVDALSYGQLKALFRADASLTRHQPEGLFALDPRNGERVLFNRARALRPHDYHAAKPREQAGAAATCVICEGNTTGIVDCARLGDGYTFINKNLFPMLYPHAGTNDASGLHFLQWTSSVHANDWHNMPLSDCETVIARTAVLERTLLKPRGNRERCFGLIKNYGQSSGGSLHHGHQQIALSSLMPRRFEENQRFESRRRHKFSEHMLRVSPPEQIVRDYDEAVLLVPYFMRRPYDMMLIMKNARPRHLFQLRAAELSAVARGWGDAIRLIREVMPQLDREIVYNVVTHCGPGAGIYFEFLPLTQGQGGYEHLGLSVCQGEPASAAEHLRNLLASQERNKRMNNRRMPSAR